MKPKQPTSADFARVFGEKTPQPILSLKKFAVLALLTQATPEELHFVLTKRAAHVRQPGDICFPGGHQEPNETLRQTALRETEEELGIPAQKIQILGKSNFMLTAYGALIQPYIGIVEYHDFCQLHFQTEEVAEVFTVPLSFFQTQQPEVHYMHWKADMSVPFPYERIENGKNYRFREYRVPELFYHYHGYTIWGLTAQIIENIMQEVTICST